MNSHVGRKDFFYYIVLVLTFITFVVGMTFALYYWIFSQKEGTSAVYTGTLSIEYMSSNVISLNLLYPARKPNFDTVDNVYRNEFKVTNKGSLDGLIQIMLDVTINEFSEGTLRYVLFNSNGDELGTGGLDGSGIFNILSNVSLKNNTSENFVLIIWLNESNEDQNIDMRKTLMGTVVVDASQQRD